MPYVPLAPVDRAFEVNEPSKKIHGENTKIKNVTKPVLPHHSSFPATNQQRKTYKSEKDSKRDFVKTLKENEFEIVVNDEGIVDTLPNALANLSSSDSSEENEVTTARKSRYEIPDDHLISRKATKILGNRKEVEMHEFKVISESSNPISRPINENVQRRHSDYACLPVIDPSGDRNSPIDDEMM